MQLHLLRPHRIYPEIGAIKLFQSYVATLTASIFPIFPRQTCFNLMQSHGLRRTAKCLVPKMGLISILCSHTGSDMMAEIPSTFNLMQSRGLLPRASNLPRQEYFNLMQPCGLLGKDTQQLHFLHNIALCILPSFGAVIIVRC